MADPLLIQTRIRAGIWEGILRTGTTLARLAVTHLGAAVEGVTVAPIPDRPGEHAVRVPIPLQALSEGVQTFLMQDAESGATLGHFTIVTGVALDEDIRAELDLLRAELDMLKRAFRRHCLETAG